MTPRTRKLSLFAVAAAIIALSTFTTAAPVPAQNNQLVIFQKDVEIIPSLPSLRVKEVPDHDCGHDESDYENDNEDEDDEDDESVKSDESEDQEDEDDEEEQLELSTEEDFQAAGESEDNYYFGQTYTGLIFDSATGKGVALSTVDTDQDLLELALFMRRKKVTSFEEIWSDMEERDNSEDYGEGEEEAPVDDDFDAIPFAGDYDEEEEEEDTFESET